MHQQLREYKDEEKLHLGYANKEKERLNTTELVDRGREQDIT
jgi:hypothetical protein